MDFMVVFFFKQKTAYEMRISDWSSYVCSSDLLAVTQNLNQFFEDAVMQEAVFFEAFVAGAEKLNAALVALAALADRDDGDCAHQAQQRAFYALVALVRALERGFGDAVNDRQFGRAACWERGCKYVKI